MQIARVAGVLAAGIVGAVLLAGCGAGGTGPTTTGSVPSTTTLAVSRTSSAAVATSTADSAAAEASAAAAASAASASAAEAAQVAAAAAAAEQAAQAAAQQAAAAQSAADQAAAAQSAADQAAADLYATGWYDERGWVSPETAARAKAAGIEAGATVPDYLRCGTLCGESPTSGELQQQDQVNPDGSAVDVNCDNGYPSGGICYPDYQAAAAACGAYLIRGNCYPSAEAARAAGEGE